ncbi:MAG: serpin family protein, partial [Cyanobacteria bacterium J06649_11]
EGKISKIVDKIEPDQVLFLLNAIYFKGSWTKEFDQEKTAKFPFYLSSGKEKEHPMMSQSGNYKYYENDKFQAVSLPYGENGRVSFYVFLPKQNSDINYFYQSLNAANWDKWMSQFVKREGSIRLPRFKMDYQATLNDALSALGMEEAFTDSANFSEMGNNLKISEVKHKTFLEVNEEGTEAAATTSVGVQLTSAKPPSQQPFEMIVNRPFFCAIRDNQTRSILFMGSIVEPMT